MPESSNSNQIWAQRAEKLAHFGPVWHTPRGHRRSERQLPTFVRSNCRCGMTATGDMTATGGTSKFPPDPVLPPSCENPPWNAADFAAVYDYAIYIQSIVR
jgi:hypothetical protein